MRKVRCAGPDILGKTRIEEVMEVTEAVAKVADDTGGGRMTQEVRRERERTVVVGVGGAGVARVEVRAVRVKV